MWWMVMLLVVSTSVRAEVLPPDLVRLGASLAVAERELETLNRTITEQRGRHRATLGEAHRASVALLRVSRWPQGLVQVQGAGTLLRVTSRQMAEVQAALGKKLEGYLALRAEVAGKLDDVARVRDDLAGRRKRLTRQQGEALRLAALDAEGLAAKLSAVQGVKAALPAVVASAPAALQPVAGQALPSGEDGVTYLAQPHAPVVAVMSGVVAYAGPFQNLGGLVITEGQGKTYAVYTGLGTVSVTQGMAVDVGAALGAMPDTGHPRLYFEVRRGGRALTLRGK